MKKEQDKDVLKPHRKPYKKYEGPFVELCLLWRRREVEIDASHNHVVSPWLPKMPSKIAHRSWTSHKLRNINGTFQKRVQLKEIIPDSESESEYSPESPMDASDESNSDDSGDEDMAAQSLKTFYNTFREHGGCVNTKEEINKVSTTVFHFLPPETKRKVQTRVKRRSTYTGNSEHTQNRKRQVQKELAKAAETCCPDVFENFERKPGVRAKLIKMC